MVDVHGSTTFFCSGPPTPLLFILSQQFSISSLFSSTTELRNLVGIQFALHSKQLRIVPTVGFQRQRRAPLPAAVIGGIRIIIRGKSILEISTVGDDLGHGFPHGGTDVVDRLADGLDLLHVLVRYAKGNELVGAAFDLSDGGGVLVRSET
ncbi:unnamed protein product [Linum trigynum]|uniref:Uncharacterized protein n=1 Tax=Linum trigynum TaxID=586398 RepID=A0AAV2F674_9ROSI